MGIKRTPTALTVTNATISGNLNGGIFALGATVTFVNLLAAGNSGPGPDATFGFGTVTTSVIGVPAGKTLGDILVPAGLADNGGPNKTVALALVAGNPAIDVGTASACATGTSVNGIDQRGMARPAACDIGAYEAQPPNVAAHANVAVAVSPPAPTVVTYTKPAGTDEQGGVLAVACLPASGSTFAVGSTTVTCTATDAVGHTATGSFQVILSAIAAPSPPAPTLPNSATLGQTTAPPDGRWVPALFLLLVLFSLAALWRVNRRARNGTG